MKVDIEHTWIGDLRISLSHNGKEVIVMDRQGGGNDNLSETFYVSEFDGESITGDWVLTVKDLMDKDTGRLLSWTITFKVDQE